MFRHPTGEQSRGLVKPGRIRNRHLLRDSGGTRFAEGKRHTFERTRRTDIRARGQPAKTRLLLSSDITARRDYGGKREQEHHEGKTG